VVLAVSLTSVPTCPEAEHWRMWESCWLWVCPLPTKLLDLGLWRRVLRAASFLVCLRNILSIAYESKESSVVS
jgi:hypothetical protein